MNLTIDPELAEVLAGVATRPLGPAGRRKHDRRHALDAGHPGHAGYRAAHRRQGDGEERRGSRARPTLRPSPSASTPPKPRARGCRPSSTSMAVASSSATCTWRNSAVSGWRPTVGASSSRSTTAWLRRTRSRRAWRTVTAPWPGWRPTSKTWGSTSTGSASAAPAPAGHWPPPWPRWPVIAVACRWPCNCSSTR